ncbi:hypothetical protein QBC34DRAFT_136823 [Podospora aff. communis PSN243]|uniref:HMG box domain-containing protein n=1 Tax=Podospora aff. communis PSN243 TaxID=3040156 RepID=A0AAV9H3S9_9PEZI|nr:hypothetical protein QBC34DRAFT_136823 [Podospora aff. communis PSN243]
MSSQTSITPARHVRDSLSWMSQQLEIIFGELGIVQYLNAFIDQGFDSWETILDITESDLDALGVKLGHRRKLQRRIANSRGVAPGTSLAPTSQSSTEDPRSPDTQRSEAPRPDVRETNTVVITKRKYRRHPKPDENAPERPPSAYVLFSNKMRDELKGRNLTFTEIAKLVGENWQNLSQAEKEPFESQAQAIKDKYHSDLAEYKKTPQYKQYAAYLQEFKAKHAAQSQDKDGLKRVKLESGGPGRTSANATPNRGSRSVSRSEDRQPSEPPRSRQRLDSAMSVNEPPYSPTTTAASPQESVHSPMMSSTDRHSAERSPTFSTSPGELPPIPARRSSNWMEDQRLEQQGPQRHHLPSLHDVFESQRMAAARHSSNDVNGFGFSRDHPSPGPIPSLAGGDNRPPLLRQEDSCSGGSASSGSSYGYPRTPIDGSLPIHALLQSKPSPHFESGQQQSYFQGAHVPDHKPPYPHHVPNGIASPVTNGYHNGAGLPHPSTINPHNSRGYSTQSPATNPPHLGKQPDANLDGMSALLKAGEMVDRRPQ